MYQKRATANKIKLQFFKGKFEEVGFKSRIQKALRHMVYA